MQEEIKNIMEILKVDQETAEILFKNGVNLTKSKEKYIGKIKKELENIVNDAESKAESLKKEFNL